MRVAVKSPVSLVVSGPGRRRTHHAFENEQALTEFALTLEQGLVAEGWELIGFDTERRTAGDRRATPRNGDRREQRELPR